MTRTAGLVALLLLTPACFWESTDGNDPERETGSEGDGAEGASRTYENGHPLDWWTEEADVLAKEGEVLVRVNAHRAMIGLGSLQMRQSLRRVARGHSRHMRKDVHDFFGHPNPEGDSPGTRLTLNGVEWDYMGENLASGSLTPRQVVDGWLASPGHRANIENPHFTRTGVGYQPGGPGDPPDFWSQVFAD
jgi:uncharacterized protein YkwD